MSQYLDVPPQRLAPEVLQGLLEEYASRDGTDYGAKELTLDDKVQRLHRQLSCKDLYLLYDTVTEEWDLLQREQAIRLLDA